MNTYKDNYEFYTSTFDEVHASDELLRKVKNMTETKPKKKIYAIRKVLYVAAAVVVMLIASNAIVYAATGETWVEKITVHVIGNGDIQNVDMEKTTDENGNISYEMNVDEKDGSSFSFSLDGNADINDGDTIVMETPDAEPTLTEEDGKIYLEISAMEFKEDITDDFADGKASVTINDTDGNKFIVNIEGTLESYEVSYSE